MPEPKSELTAKEVLDFIGIEGNDLNTIKEKFNEQYVPLETHNKTLGEVNGKVTHAIKKGFKEIGIEVTSDELKDVNTVDIPGIYASKVKDRFTDLEGQSKLTKEQMETKLNEDLGKYKQQLEDKNELLSTVQNEYSAFKLQVETDNKNREVNTFKSAAIGELNFSDKVDKYQKKGFFSEIDEGYKFSVEDGKQTIRDKEGKLIQSTVKAGEAATFKEFYEAKFKESGLGAVADTKKVTTFSVPASTPTSTGQAKRQVAARH